MRTTCPICFSDSGYPQKVKHFFRSINLLAIFVISLFFSLSNIPLCVYTNLLIHSSSDGYLDCFYFLLCLSGILSLIYFLFSFSVLLLVLNL